MTFVVPAPTPSVVEGNALEDLFQATLAGVTGIAPSLVRPRWQPEPANIPDFGTDWLAFGITSMPPDAYAYLRQVDSVTCELSCNEELRVLCSFYGPNAQANAGRLRDGLKIDQNRWPLAAQNIQLVKTGEHRQVPALQKQVWTKRVDVPGTWRRWVVRQYPVNAIASLPVSYLDNEQYQTKIVPSPPPP